MPESLFLPKNYFLESGLTFLKPALSNRYHRYVGRAIAQISLRWQNPMFLVHVISGLHGVVLSAQLERTFEISSGALPVFLSKSSVPGVYAEKSMITSHRSAGAMTSRGECASFG